VNRWLEQKIPWLLRPAVDLLDFFFPAICPACEKLLPANEEALFCPACAENLIPLPPGHCPRCALPFGATTSSMHLCADCSRQSPPYQRVFAGGLYDGSLKQVIQRFKYEGRVDLDRCLAQLLIHQLADLPLEGENLLVPVPLHPRRLRKRGYNQSLLLAKVLMPALRERQKHTKVKTAGNVRLEPDLLRRVTDGHHQQGLSARQRTLNLRGAIVYTRRLQGENLILVDDVMTTGATVSVCAQALLDAGAARVLVAVVARTPRY
jgi:ComF family protein